MEKYAVADDDLIQGLRNEEHTLMLQIMNHMSSPEKTASEERDFQSVQSRLHAVRAKISDHDLKKTSIPG